jgi:2-oxoglutarate dehydrogenase complex dehydrogenase (E1) component-like enzyme
MGTHREENERVLDAFRRWGYLQADLDPVGHLQPEPHPELELTGVFEMISEEYRDKRIPLPSDTTAIAALILSRQS